MSQVTRISRTCKFLGLCPHTSEGFYRFLVVVKLNECLVCRMKNVQLTLSILHFSFYNDQLHCAGFLSLIHMDVLLGWVCPREELMVLNFYNWTNIWTISASGIFLQYIASRRSCLKLYLYNKRELKLQQLLFTWQIGFSKYYFPNECKCFIGISKHWETNESTRPQAKCFYCFEVFGYPDETRSTSFGNNFS